MNQSRIKPRVNRPFTYLRIIRWLNIYMLLASLITIPITLSSKVSALVQNPTAAPQISFTFDDGLASAVTNALPTLTKYGLTGTEYVITGCVGMATAPNTCHANTSAQYMTWPQIKQLQAAGWEIGSHTVTHPYLASSDASDGQPNKLTNTQVIQELTNSKSALAAQGINATAFSTPYGDYNNFTLAQIAKLYTSHRGFADQNANTWPYDDYLLNDYHVQAGVTVAQVEARIDTAIANKEWLILTMHDILPSPSTNPDDYQYAVSDLDQIAAYAKSKINAGLIRPVNISSGLVTSDTNLIPNSTFDSGITSGWRTDAPTTITWDRSNNGSFPSATNSIKLVAQAANNHLFSPQVSVDPSTTYLLKNFLNVSTISAGIIGFYIDEYDVNGNWISGQYKNGERNAFVEDYNFSYKPSSISVKKASLQVIMTGGSAATAYLDNVQWFPLSTQVATTSNLLPNQAFDDGIADGWTTDDSTDIKPDSANHGSPANPVNSISLKSTTKNVHLFSPKIAIDSTKAYTLTNYIDLQSVTNGGEVGFYIDEYDSAGSWTSGQYITGVRGVSTGDVAFNYKPTSSNVKTASLQVIISANAGINAYFDNARWYVN